MSAAETVKPPRTFWAIFRLADDLPGVWVGHCLELDVMTQGRPGGGVESAVELLREAIGITLAEDAMRGVDSKARRAPAAFWRELEALRVRPAPAGSPVAMAVDVEWA